MFDMMFTGTRVAKQCVSGSNYFSSIDECVPVSIASTSAFTSSLLSSKTCTGRLVSTLSDLEGLRFCNTIIGGLDIEVSDLSADFTSLYDVGTITGMLMLMFLSRND